jgi:hypothetical protein
MKIFAYDRWKPDATLEQIIPLLKEEARQAWELYTKDIVRESYLRQDHPGALLVLECESVDEARRVLDELPMTKAGLVEYEFIPVGAFTPWQNLFEGADEE